MKINEVIVKEWTGPGKEFAPPTPKDFLPKKKQKLVMAQDEDEGLTSGADIVLSKNGEQAVRDLKLSDQEVELLKAVALGWADPSDLGDLEQDIFDYWLDNNPEDFNPDLHGGGADPSDTILDELESWFEDTVPENNKGESVMKIEDILRMRKLAGLNENKINSCFKDEKLVDNIIKTRSIGEKKYNINSTPTLIINEKKYSAMSYENFEKIIENLIN